MSLSEAMPSPNPNGSPPAGTESREQLHTRLRKTLFDDIRAVAHEKDISIRAALEKVLEAGLTARRSESIHHDLEYDDSKLRYNNRADTCRVTINDSGREIVIDDHRGDAEPLALDTRGDPAEPAAVNLEQALDETQPVAQST